MKIQIKRKLLMKKKKKKKNKETYICLVTEHKNLFELPRGTPTPPPAPPLFKKKRKHKIKIVTLLRLRSEIKSPKRTIRNNISRNCFLLCSAESREQHQGLQ